MSCNCTTPTYNCGNCGNTVPACTCSQTPILPPVYICPEPETCDEVFPLECVEYIGADIKCSATVDILHPSIEHYIVLQDGTRTDRRLPSILNNINSQLCYIFSKEYISQVLTIIQSDIVLSQLFCEIACSCDCGATPPVGPRCSLNCPLKDDEFNWYYETGVMWHYTFDVQPDNPLYIPVTSYKVHYYINNGSGLYEFKGVNDYPIATYPGPNITMDLTQALNGSDDILVLVQIFTDNEVCTKGLPPSLEGYKAADFGIGGIYNTDPSVCWYTNNPITPIECPVVNLTSVTPA